MQIQYLDQKDHLEKSVATHSSILAGKIPWTEEPGRLQPVGSQRVGRLKRLSMHIRIDQGTQCGVTPTAKYSNST